VALDAEGYIYLTGITTSSNFPTCNAFQSRYGGGDRDDRVGPEPLALGLPLGVLAGSGCGRRTRKGAGRPRRRCPSAPSPPKPLSAAQQAIIAEQLWQERPIEKIVADELLYHHKNMDSVWPIEQRTDYAKEIFLLLQAEMKDPALTTEADKLIVMEKANAEFEATLAPYEAARYPFSSLSLEVILAGGREKSPFDLPLRFLHRCLASNNLPYHMKNKILRWRLYRVSNAQPVLDDEFNWIDLLGQDDEIAVAEYLEDQEIFSEKTQAKAAVNRSEGIGVAEAPRGTLFSPLQS
jgi:hypothetical protein